MKDGCVRVRKDAESTMAVQDRGAARPFRPSQDNE